MRLRNAVAGRWLSMSMLRFLENERLTKEIATLKSKRIDLLQSLTVQHQGWADESDLRRQIWDNSFLTMKAMVAKNRC